MALRGLFAVIFGLIALVAPGIALLAFIYVFAAYALVDGGIAVITAIQERELLYRWGWVLFEGILSILVGIIAFANPGLTALVLLYIIVDIIGHSLNASTLLPPLVDHISASLTWKHLAQTVTEDREESLKKEERSKPTQDMVGSSQSAWQGQHFWCMSLSRSGTPSSEFKTVK
jgi:hypothetical protein